MRLESDWAVKLTVQLIFWKTASAEEFVNCCSAVSDLGRASSIGLDTETEVFRLAGEELQCTECGKSELLGGDGSLEESDF